MLYGLSRPTADVDVLEIAPRAAADAFSEVAMLGGPLFQKYGVYVDEPLSELRSGTTNYYQQDAWLSHSSCLPFLGRKY
jgi:hypothetical protein